eukprot:458502_1
MPSLNPSPSYARWIIFSAIGITATFLLYKTYQKIAPNVPKKIASIEDLSAEDKDIFDKYAYQLRIGISRGTVTEWRSKKELQILIVYGYIRLAIDSISVMPDELKQLCLIFYLIPIDWEKLKYSLHNKLKK